MKKNKKFDKTTPVAKTIDNFKPGTVGEFIALLSEFPKDGEFELGGKAFIKNIFDENNKPHNIVIHPRDEVVPTEQPANDDYIEYADPVKINDAIDNNFYYGCVNPHSKSFISVLRRRASDDLIEMDICKPSDCEKEWEKNVFSPEQLNKIDEIRHKNAVMAESMAEIYRRQISAILEYTLQANLQFTNKTMCTLCDHSDDV